MVLSTGFEPVSEQQDCPMMVRTTLRKHFANVFTGIRATDAAYKQFILTISSTHMTTLLYVSMRRLLVANRGEQILSALTFSQQCYVTKRKLQNRLQNILCKEWQPNPLPMLDLSDYSQRV